MPNGASLVRSLTPGPALIAHVRVEDKQGRPVEGPRSMSGTPHPRGSTKTRIRAKRR
jgi:hypothetical protein